MAVPVASFTSSATVATASASIGFTDTSTNAPTSWSWDFGDGGTSNAQNPNYYYQHPGVYTVKLTATNTSGSNTVTRTNPVVIQSPGAVSLRASGTVVSSSTTTIVPAYPTNAIGDLLLMTVVTASTVTTPTGWTLLDSATLNAACKTYVFERYNYTSIQTGSQTVAIAASSTTVAAITAYAGARCGLPDFSSTTDATNGSATTSMSQTLAGARGSYAIWANGRSANSTLSGFAVTSGTWLVGKAVESAGTVSMTVANGPLIGGTAGMSLSATSSASATSSGVTVVLYPSNSVPITDTFTGTNATTLNAYLPSSWSTGSGNMSATIQNNAFQLQTTTATSLDGGYVTMAGYSAGNVDISGTFVTTSTDVYAAVGLAAGGNTAVNGSTVPASGMFLNLLTAPIALFSSNASGTASGNLQTGSTSIVAGTAYSFRFQYFSSGLVRARVWTGTEPSAWELSATGYTGYSGSPSFAIQNASANQRTVTFDTIVVTDPTYAALPFTETFTGSDGTSWSANWSIAPGTADRVQLPYSLNANRGMITPKAYSFEVAEADLVGVVPTTDTDIVATIIFDSALSVEQYVGLSINNDHGNVNTAGNSPYGWHIELQPQGNTLALYYGGISDQPKVVSKTFWASTRVRFRRLGTIFYVRAWQAGGAEPSTWDLTFDQSTSTTTRTLGAGVPGLWAQNGSAATSINYYFDDVVVSGGFGLIKMYAAGSFAVKPIKVYNGSAWIVKPVRVWNGTTWTTSAY